MPQTVATVNYDVTFRFNPTTSGVSLRTFSSQSDFDNVACYISKTSVVPSGSELTNNLGTTSAISNVAGFSLNGVVIFGSSSAENIDPFFPKKWTNSKTV